MRLCKNLSPKMARRLLCGGRRRYTNMSDRDAEAKDRIIWAIDPFGGNRDILHSAAWCIRALVKGSPAEVQPVYVLPERSADLPFQMGPEFVKAVQTSAQDEVESVLTRIRIPNVLPLRVLSCASFTVREAAHELIRFAKETQSELIVVSSHGRRGIQRWLLGSFAETLSLYADVPLVVVQPNWKRTPGFGTILYPTDFSRQSIQAFSAILDFAEKQKSRVILFHKVTDSFYPVYDFALAAHDIYEQGIQEGILANEQTASKVVSEAGKRGVSVDIVFDRSRKGSVEQAILNQSQRVGGIIAMVSHSGPLSSVLIGSITRQVLRGSKRPVWVVHPGVETENVSSQVEPLASQVQSDPRSLSVKRAVDRMA